MTESLLESAPVRTAPPLPALALTGYLPRPRSFDLRAVQALPRHELGPLQVNCFTGRPVSRVESYAGARLIDLLDQAGLSEWSRGDRKRCVVMAGGADGYHAIFSWNELYNSPIGAGVLVLYERNAQPLDAHLGALCLISAGDNQLGPRHLRCLDSVTVRKL